MITAVIPAAGQSRRMGRPKLSLPLGESTVLAHVLIALQQGGVDQSLVVIGPHVRELESIALEAGAMVCSLDHETPDMRATVEQGLLWLELHCQPTEDNYWLLVPADHPTLEPEIIRELIRAQKHSSAPILIPVHDSRRGHPALLSWKEVSGIRKHAKNEGINAYLRTREKEVLEVPIRSAEILTDLDTPSDYDRLIKRWSP